MGVVSEVGQEKLVTSDVVAGSHHNRIASDQRPVPNAPSIAGVDDDTVKRWADLSWARGAVG